MRADTPGAAYGLGYIYPKPRARTERGPKLERDMDTLAIDTIRFLAVDMVQAAGSGHPGMPLGAAPMAYTLWDRFLRFDPTDPEWPDRDRFVLSAGHGCALLYALLHLTGYDLPMEELRRFRQWGSRTPGHPERLRTPGVEASTGPLGQGVGNAVGMAIAESSLAARFNRPGHDLIDHCTYALCSDGDLMEGVSSEAASLAGHLGLGKLIMLYDDNGVSIEGGTSLAFTEDRVARFAAYGWHVQTVRDGNDLGAIASAIEAARAETDRPSFIAVSTHIGYGSPNRQDTAAAHGEPLGVEEVRLTKAALGWPVEPAFLVPAPALAHMRCALVRGAALNSGWRDRLEAYRAEFPDEAAEFERRVRSESPSGWDADMPVFSDTGTGIATRDAGGEVMNAIASRVPELIGGSADLAPSTKTWLKDFPAFSVADRTGRNIHFGVREHAMGAIVNGMACHGGIVPFGSTFLIFSDYMRPPIRLAALSGLRVIHVFTHDSIGLGEDGPTHQAVEQLLGLRSIPGVVVIRPADANETAAAWRVAMGQTQRPVLLALTRQKVPVLDPAVFPMVADGVPRGAYVLAGDGGGAPDAIVVATGSEVHLALGARQTLGREGLNVAVVSAPCLALFTEQPQEYRDSVVPSGIPVVSVEAGVTLGWRAYLGEGSGAIGVDMFGASAPGETVLREFGFTVEAVAAKVRAVV